METKLGIEFNNIISLEGVSPRTGVMEMAGTSISAGAPIQLQRVVWTRLEDGGLTQDVSVSNDNGQQWSANFSGRYVPTDRATPTKYPDDKYPLNSALTPQAVVGK